MKRSSLKLMLIAGAVGATVLAGAAPAYAAYEYSVAVAEGSGNTCGDNYWVMAFEPGLKMWGEACLSDSDDFHLGDRMKDSSSVGVQWRTASGSRTGLCRLSTGVDTYGRCNKIFTETVQWRLGRCDSAVGDCTVPAGYRNWSPWQG